MGCFQSRMCLKSVIEIHCREERKMWMLVTVWQIFFPAVIWKFQCLYFITNGGVHPSRLMNLWAITCFCVLFCVLFVFFFPVVQLEFVSLPLLDRAGTTMQKQLVSGTQRAVQTQKNKGAGLSWQACGAKPLPDNGVRMRVHQMILNSLVWLC